MIEVVAAIICIEDKILCFQRGPSRYPYISFKYEFPGGKIEVGESPKQALKREILEELDLSLNVGNKLTTVVHDYPDFSIKMHCYICHADKFKGVLREHIAYVALKPQELKRLDWIDADKPVVTMITDEWYDSIV